MRDQNDMNGFDAIRLGLIGAIILSALLLVVRFMGAFRFAILGFLVVMILAYGLWQAFRYWRKRRKQRAHQKTRLGQIQQRLDRARHTLDLHQQAIEELQASQTELRKATQVKEFRAENMKARTTQLLTEYTEEIALRERKLEFYRQSLRQLEKLEAHHLWLATLAQKEAELARYRQQHEREAEAMESLRWTLEKEYDWLQNWSVLSDQLEATDSPESVEKMRESLKDLLV